MVPQVFSRRAVPSHGNRGRDHLARGKGWPPASLGHPGDGHPPSPSASPRAIPPPPRGAERVSDREGFGGWPVWGARPAMPGEIDAAPPPGAPVGSYVHQARSISSRAAAPPPPGEHGFRISEGERVRVGREVGFISDQDDEAFPGTSSQEAWREQELSGEFPRLVRRRSDSNRRQPEEEQWSGDADGAERKSVRGRQECVWVVGHSFIHWAANRAQHRPYGLNLELDERSWKIVWLSHRGMKWDNLLSLVEQSASQLELPKIVLIHLGGNDVGVGSCKDLIIKIKKDFGTLMNAMPETHWGWSDIIVRFKFLQSHLWCRGVKKLNSQVGKWVVRQRGFWVRHEWAWEVIPGYFRSDGVHLSDIGIDLFNTTIQEGLTQVIGNMRTAVGGNNDN
ncbi:uncharacterized protein LOC115099458 [Rhinatrema bivittatum]|uniref:uncharacterized protein LOC115099458 n=1 Tax=Rhinatrema bivittatum TaxID=194408 RepID=UPI00112DE3AA|nr:uncharacterized protein LOC115099458 [Rhinatrema bivittatum]